MPSDPWKKLPSPHAGPRAVIGNAAQKLQAKVKAQKIDWPEPGDPLEGAGPGEWQHKAMADETGFLPKVCPVRPLGFEGENYFFEDTKGQVFCTGTAAFGVERIQKLFSGHEKFLYWAWPAKEAKKLRIDPGFKAERVRRDLYAAADARGPWNMVDMVRGRGAWLDGDGRLVLHCGEYLYIDGALEPTGDRGEHFYVRRPSALVPWSEPVDVDDNPAVELFNAFATWNLVRGDVDALLLLGWIGVALMGAALNWRPSAFIVGGAGTGKSELQKLIRQVLGRSMISSTNATEAGLYQQVGHDSLPIGIDEMEGEDAPAQNAKIIKMARDAASGSLRIRGGADHKGVEFQARSTFLFSAINPPHLPVASLTRMCVFQLQELKARDGKVPELSEPDHAGPKLLRRVADGFHDFSRVLEQYRDALRRGKHSSRGQDTFGTFLAAAHLLLGDEGMEKCGHPIGDLSPWGERLAADTVHELENATANWAKCIQRLFSARVAQWKGGSQDTVGELVEKAMAGAELENINPQLAHADVRLVTYNTLYQNADKASQKGDPSAGEALNGVDPETLVLAVSNQGDGLAGIFADTEWAGRGPQGAWGMALKQSPQSIATHNKHLNRIGIAGGQRRCTMIFLNAWKQWEKENV